MKIINIKNIPTSYHLQTTIHGRIHGGEGIGDGSPMTFFIYIESVEETTQRFIL